MRCRPTAVSPLLLMAGIVLAGHAQTLVLRGGHAGKIIQVGEDSTAAA